MTYKAYLDNIKAQTGNGPEYYREMAKEKRLTQYGELLEWLKTECELGHGHASVIILYIQNPALAKKKIAEDVKNEKPKNRKA